MRFCLRYTDLGVETNCRFLMTITLFGYYAFMGNRSVCARGIENKIIIKPSLARLYDAHA